VARLIFVGLPGVGKTSVAQALAQRWGCAAIDTDDVIASAVGSTAAQYLRAEGELAFRQRETDALEAVQGADAVVSTGGGIVVSSRARELLAGQFTLWLDCDDDVIVPRLTDSERPLLGDDPVGARARLRGERDQWYRAVSRARIDASGTLDEVVELVIDAVSRVTP
jgi:shikimate kinase